MGTAERQERERAAKRALIMDAARELFAEKGYDAVTLRQIAKRIEYSTTAIYVHFRDKRDLMQQMVAEDFAAFGSRFAACMHIEDPVERLRSLGGAYVDFGLSMPRHYQMMFMTVWPEQLESDEPPSADDIEQDGYRMLVETICACIQAGRFRPELAVPQLAAQIVWSAVHGLVSLLITKGEIEDLGWQPREQLKDQLLDVMIRGLLRA